MKKHPIALLLLAAAMATALCACGGPKSNGSGSDDANTSRADSNELAVGIAQDLGDSLDPYQMTAAGTREILFNVYEGLYKPTSSGDFVPAVCCSTMALPWRLLTLFILSIPVPLPPLTLRWQRRFRMSLL